MRKNFNSFLAMLNNLNTRISFVILTEVWIGSIELPLYNLPNYNVFGKCNDDYRAGGSICYVKNDNFVINIDFKMATADSLLLEIKNNKSRFYLLAIHRSLKFPEALFMEELEDKLPNLHLNTIIIGDINSDLIKSYPVAQSYKNAMSRNCFISLINSTTRKMHRSNLCLDHIFIKFRDASKFCSAIFDTDLTDHCCIRCACKDIILIK